MFLLNVLMVLIQGNNAASLVQGLVLNVYFEHKVLSVLFCIWLTLE